MKKVITILLILVSFLSCNNDDDNSISNRTELIIGLWNLETINGVPVDTDSVDPIDIQYQFKTNNEYIFYSDGNINSEGIWNFNTDFTKITFNNETFDILSLESNTMKLSFTAEPNLGSVLVEQVYSRVE